MGDGWRWVSCSHAKPPFLMVHSFACVNFLWKNLMGPEGVKKTRSGVKKTEKQVPQLDAGVRGMPTACRMLSKSCRTTAASSSNDWKTWKRASSLGSLKAPRNLCCAMGIEGCVVKKELVR